MLRSAGEFAALACALAGAVLVTTILWSLWANARAARRRREAREAWTADWIARRRAAEPPQDTMPTRAERMAEQARLHALQRRVCHDQRCRGRSKLGHDCHDLNCGEHAALRRRA